MGDVFITDKIHNRLKQRAKQEGVRLEGLAGVLLKLALDDEKMVDQAIQLIKREGLGGATDMAAKGW